MSARPSIDREIVELLDAMPGWFAAADVRAGWLRRKAAVQRRIAADTDDPRLAREAAAMVDRADQHAADLETGR